MKRITNKGALVLMAVVALVSYSLGHKVSQNIEREMQQAYYCEMVEHKILQGYIIELDTCENYIDTVFLQMVLDINIEYDIHNENGTW